MEEFDRMKQLEVTDRISLGKSDFMSAFRNLGMRIFDFKWLTNGWINILLCGQMSSIWGFHKLCPFSSSLKWNCPYCPGEDRAKSDQLFRQFPVRSSFKNMVGWTNEGFYGSM